MATPQFIEIEVITDYLVDTDAEQLLASKIRLPKRQLTVGDLLRLKLSQEIHAFNERKTARYGTEYLPPDEYAAMVEEGEELLGEALKKGKVNPDMEYRLLLQAFNEHKFKVVINDSEPRAAQERFTVDEQTKIRFVRLVPYR